MDGHSLKASLRVGLGAFLLAVVLGSLFAVYITRQPVPSPPTLDELFQGGIVVSFREGVSVLSPRGQEIIASVDGHVVRQLLRMNAVVIHLDPPLTELKETVSLIKELESYPDVEFASPEMNVFIR